MESAQRESGALRTIGWREWIALPCLHVPAVKAKVDTGARSSSLHAFDLESFHDRGVAHVRFKIHPFQRTARGELAAEAELLEYRHVKSSGGHETRRPVVLTQISLFGQQWTIELTLASRDAMGFRMLLGREAIRRRFLVDSGHSYLSGIPPEARRPKRRPSS